MKDIDIEKVSLTYFTAVNNLIVNEEWNLWKGNRFEKFWLEKVWDPQKIVEFDKNAGNSKKSTASRHSPWTIVKGSLIRRQLHINTVYNFD